MSSNEDAPKHIPANAEVYALATLAICVPSVFAHLLVGYATLRSPLFTKQLALRANFYISLAAGLHVPYFIFGAIQQLMEHSFDNIYVDVWSLTSDVFWYSMIFQHVFLVIYRVLIIKTAYVHKEEHCKCDYPILFSWLAGIIFTVAHNARSYDVIYTYDLEKVGWVSRAKFGLAEGILLAIKIGLMTVGLICTGIIMRRIVRQTRQVKKRSRFGLQQLRIFLVGSIIFVLLFLREFIRVLIENIWFFKYFWTNSYAIRNMLAVLVVCLPPYLSVILNTQLRNQIHEQIFGSGASKSSFIEMGNETTVTKAHPSWRQIQIKVLPMLRTSHR